MSVVGIRLSTEIPQLQQLKDGIGRLFTPKEKSQIMREAIKKAIAPTLERLKQVSPVGPTGNLQRAADSKVVPYPADGVAVGLVGFRRSGRQSSESAAGGAVRAGKDRGYHQWWLEQGTQDRFVSKISNTPYTRKAHQRRMRSGTVADVQQHTVKGQGAVIASSFNKLGPFKMNRTERREDGQRVQTDPAYQRAFFKKGKQGESAIKMAAVTPGGKAGLPPLQTAWDQTRPTVQDILIRELQLTIEQTLDSLVQQAGSLPD